jgi:glycosyltransferase involved in cell wall biosynthesis
LFSVLHLGKFYPPHHGGIETHVRDLAVRQARTCRVTVIAANTGRRNERAVIEGVEVFRVARVGTVASMPVCPGLTNAIRKCPADLVHLHTPNPGAAFSFLRSGHKGKLIITHHADTLGRKVLRSVANIYVQRAMERASVILATSQRYLDSSEELAPFREKCRVIPLGIDPAPQEDTPLAAKGNGLARPLILAVGRLVPYKGFDILIRAMKHVDGRLLLIGSGPQEMALRALAVSEGVQEKVEIRGRVPDLQPCFRQASIFVLPSTTRAEAFGIVQLEAMAAGLPVINTDLESGVPEVSADGETGLTVAPGDAGALAGAMQRLLQEEALREQFGQAARIRVQTEFTADRMTERTMAVYEKALEQ